MVSANQGGGSAEIGSRLDMMANFMRRLNEPLTKAAGLEPFIWTDPGGGTLPVPHTDVLKISRFETEEEANSLWEKVSLDLANLSNAPGNVCVDADGIFEELALNAAQHSHSPYGSYAMLEYVLTKGETVFLIGIADGGIGIPASLRSNPDYRLIANDEEAISRATEQDVTGTMESRGAGLHHVIERVRAYRGELLIVSGAGYSIVRGGGDQILGRLADLGRPQYNGTTVLVSLPVPTMR